MSEVLIPPWIIPEDESQEPLDEGSSVFGAAFAPGIAQRQSYGGMRLKLSRRHTVRLDEKAQLLSALRSTRGRYSTLRSKVHFALRGSFPVSELLPNGVFPSGTTGWAAGSQYAVGVNDRILRGTRTIVSAATPVAHPSATVTCVQYAPYVARWYTQPGRGAYGGGLRVDIGSTADGAEYTQGTAFTSYGVRSEVAVPTSTAISTRLVDVASSGQSPGDYVSVPYVSIARCALVDNGPNLLLRSDEINDASWTKSGCTTTTNAVIAPDGTTTADGVIEDTANSQHTITQVAARGSVAADLCLSGFIFPASREVYMRLDDGAGNGAEGYLTGAGVVSASNVGTGTNARIYVSNAGNGFYFVTLVARCPASASARVIFYLYNGGISYLGNGAGGAYFWRCGISVSSVPARASQTTSVSTSGVSQSGNALYLKGLPVSTSGLLLPDDVVEINGELKTCTATLNSDANGMGYLQFEPALVRSPADNDPVIVHHPMGKFLMSNLKVDNEFGTQAIVSYDIEHIYE